MANICRTTIKINAVPSVTADFVKRFDTVVDGPYPPKEGDIHIVDEFGAKADLFIDRVGSKWVTIYDGGIEWHDEETGECQLQLESAWYPPSDMIKEIYKQLTALDSKARVFGSYWDEGYDPIGVYEVVDGEIIDVETEVEYDDEKEYFWDEVIDPAFESLQEELDLKLQ
jgi:hypothetical protein